MKRKSHGYQGQGTKELAVNPQLLFRDTLWIRNCRSWMRLCWRTSLGLGSLPCLGKSELTLSMSTLEVNIHRENLDYLSLAITTRWEKRLKGSNQGKKRKKRASLEEDLINQEVWVLLSIGTPMCLLQESKLMNLMILVLLFQGTSQLIKCALSIQMAPLKQWT